MFKVPNASSSPPTTPNSQLQGSKEFFHTSHPSTTPAGPPPYSLTDLSTTPAGPPPSSAFGSVPYGSSFISRTPPQSRRNEFRSSPLKAASSRRIGRLYDAIEDDYDMDQVRGSESYDVRGDARDDIQNKGPSHSIESFYVSAIARSIASTPAVLYEPGAMILGTDQIIEELYSVDETVQDGDLHLEQSLINTVQLLLKLWSSACDREIETQGIGPGNSASDITKAVFLTSLLMTFHHPGRRNETVMSSTNSRSALNKAVPEVLLDWLHAYHNPYPNDYVDLMNTPNNPTASERFWDVVASLSLRGKIKEVLNLLKEADFSHAYTALEDGYDKMGYRGTQLGNAHRVVNRAATTIATCPAFRTGDWDVKGTEWTFYRQRITHELSFLEKFAQDSNMIGSGEHEPFEAASFGLSGRRDDHPLSRMSRRAQSKVPWALYESLKQLYAQILGSHAEVVASSSDWVEATIGMAIWWDGNDDFWKMNGLASSRISSERPQHIRSVDVRPVAAYQEKLMISLRHITTETDEPELQINTMSLIEVGLACIFEGETEGLIGILKGWSQTISTAVAEVANFGQWLCDSPSPSRALLKNFDQSDLMVLSVTKNEGHGVKLDLELLDYARLLKEKGSIQDSKSPAQPVDGWEMAVTVLSRIQDERLATTQITQVVENLKLDAHRIARLTQLCNDLSLPGLGRAMSAKYADQLANSSSDYGEALCYYARAHDVQKVEDVLNLLTSTSLVKSSAYPPTASLDATLSSLLYSPNRMLADLRAIDRQAADILSGHLAGYATLRRFYDLRDAELLASPKQKPALRPLARKRAAANALVSVIMSAADSIHGGLYDESVVSIVPVDVLLVLLGEALIFLQQPLRILSTSHVFALLKAVEDVATVSSSIFAQCEECFNSALAEFQGSKLASSQSLVKASTSSNLGSSQFLLVNGSMSESQSSGNRSGVQIGSEANGEQYKVKRAWDWRRGLEKTTTAKDVLLIMRLGLAKEVSRAWTENNT